MNFNLVCEVKRKTLPLTLNVKAEGYSMNCLVLCEDLSGNKVELTSSGLNAINFGEVKDTLHNLFRSLFTKEKWKKSQKC